eukprot:XP_011676779.1 PREDICTED: uncharacterized protein LOC105444344 isoform X2 [Strongylocentrotus purpuratus]
MPPKKGRKKKAAPPAEPVSEDDEQDEVRTVRKKEKGKGKKARARPVLKTRGRGAGEEAPEVQADELFVEPQVEDAEEEKMADVVRVKSPEMEAEKATKEAEETGNHGHIYAPFYSYR